jgi:hypothetical protein
LNSGANPRFGMAFEKETAALRQPGERVEAFKNEICKKMKDGIPPIEAIVQESIDFCQKNKDIHTLTLAGQALDAMAKKIANRLDGTNFLIKLINTFKDNEFLFPHYFLEPLVLTLNSAAGTDVAQFDDLDDILPNKKFPLALAR